MKELLKQIKGLSMQITTLKNQLAANTQARGHNTIALDSMTKETKGLTEIVKKWKGTDEDHHDKEIKADQEKVKLMKELKGLFEGHRDLKIRRTS